jgi:hypothetical protein
MSMTWRHLPPPARAIAVAASDAVVLAQADDRDAYEVAVKALAGTEGAGMVLGAVVRLMLEDLHPDGLASDDIRRIGEECVRASAAWEPATDPHLVLVLLAGALGVHDQDEDAPRVAPELLTRNAVVLVTHLLTSAPYPLDRYLTAAFADIERAELHD